MTDQQPLYETPALQIVETTPPPPLRNPFDVATHGDVDQAVANAIPVRPARGQA